MIQNDCERLEIISFQIFNWKLWLMQNSWVGSLITSRLNSTLAQSSLSVSSCPSRAPGLPWSQATSTFLVKSTSGISPRPLIGVGLVLTPCSDLQHRQTASGDWLTEGDIFYSSWGVRRFSLGWVILPLNWLYGKYNKLKLDSQFGMVKWNESLIGI